MDAYDDRNSLVSNVDLEELFRANQAETDSPMPFFDTEWEPSQLGQDGQENTAPLLSENDDNRMMEEEAEEEHDAEHPTRTIAFDPEMGLAFEDMLGQFRFTYEPNSFHGERISLRWSSLHDDRPRQVDLNALSDAETADAADDDDTFTLGKHWRAYERMGANFHPGSPLWRIHAELGVELENLRRGGLFIQLLVVAFPHEDALRKIVYFGTDHIKDADDWERFKEEVLEVLEERLQTMEAHIAETQSNESTDAELSGDEEEEG